MIYKLAKTRYRRTLDQEDIVYIADERKHIITEPNRIIGRWLSYFKHLLNIENERDGNRTEVNQREDAQHTITEPFKLMEVEKQMKKMQNNKACGPDGVPTESLRLVDKIDPMFEPPVGSNMVKVSHAHNHSATEAVKWSLTYLFISVGFLITP